MWFYRSILVATLLWAVAPQEALACTETRVKSLASRGQTASQIARTCQMTVDKVSKIIQGEDEDEEDEDQGKLPKGSPVGQCGCWGSADPRARVPHSSCKSGYARPSMCNIP